MLKHFSYSLISQYDYICDLCNKEICDIKKEYKNPTTHNSTIKCGAPEIYTFNFNYKTYHCCYECYSKKIMSIFIKDIE